MAEVKILIKGYLSAETNGRTCSTISLIKDGGIIMISDPGTVKNQDVIKEALKKEGLKIDDINFVFITHSHIDHYRNIGMFPDAKTLEYFGIWEEDKQGEGWKENFSENIKIIKTPGHSNDNLTLLIKTNKGIVAVCGDVFWKENSPANDPYASDKEKLKESREKILKLADYIIPGHGP
ncbi:MAG: MBL fold metallo-hydrolase, partial [Nanoarchaeota archaeon]